VPSRSSEAGSGTAEAETVGYVVHAVNGGNASGEFLGFALLDNEIRPNTQQ
jgi:hypothetical protein